MKYGKFSGTDQRGKDYVGVANVRADKDVTIAKIVRRHLTVSQTKSLFFITR